MFLSAMPTHLFYTFKNGDSTISMGSLFQWITTLCVKKFFVIFNINFSWNSSRRNCNCVVHGLYLITPPCSSLFILKRMGTCRVCTLEFTWRLEVVMTLFCCFLNQEHKFSANIYLIHSVGCVSKLGLFWGATGNILYPQSFYCGWAWSGMI